MGTRSVVAIAALTSLLVVPAMPAGAQTPAGKGSASSSVTGASLVVDTVGDVADLSLVLGKLDSTSTLDKVRSGATLNHARGTVTPVAVAVAGITAPLRSFTVSRDENNPGEDAPDNEPIVAFTIPSDISADDLGVSDSAVADLVNGIGGTVNDVVPAGLVANGSARPLDLRVVFDAVKATFSGRSIVEQVEALGGLVKLTALDASEQETFVTTDLARGSLRQLSVDSITVLDMDTLFGLLGLDPRGDIPLGTLAAMAGELGVPLPTTLGSLSLEGLDSWADIFGTLSDAKAQLLAQLDLGAVCDLLPGAINDLLGQVGVDCSTLQATLDEVNGLLDELLDVLDTAVSSAALLTVEDLTASVQAVASVTEDGVAEISSAAVGSLGKVKVGGTDVGALAADLTQKAVSTLQPQWDELRADSNNQVDTVLGWLGDAYMGIVDVIPMNIAVQTTRAEDHEGSDGDYAVADAQVSLLQVKVSLPVELPAPLDAALTSLPLSPLAPATTTPITLPLLNIAHVRDAGIRPAPTLATTVTLDVGVLSAHAEHTRPGVEITGGGDNRTWNARTGFGGPLPDTGIDGPLPRTGSASGTWPLLAFAVLVSVAFGLNWLGRARVRRVTVS